MNSSRVAAPSVDDEWSQPPSLAVIQEAARRLSPHTVKTPVIPWVGPAARDLFGEDTEVWLKLELLQISGSFKPRGALNVALQLDPRQRANGLTAFSSGNHAAAVAYAARVLGTTAKVVMLASANPARVANCQRFGGEVVFAPDSPGAQEMANEIMTREGRALIHPYEGPRTSAGTATIALELAEQIPNLDAVIVAIGGGGLCSGIGPAMKLLRPGCEVLAVEPAGADKMYRSFKLGSPQATGVTNTIADSLSPPTALPYSFGLCRQSVDELVLLTDDDMKRAMSLLYNELKLAVEPGGAASTAGAIGPFRKRIQGKCVALVVCGSNIDVTSLKNLIG